jgi:tetratricopeptide (TPR) repeat protein
VSDAGHAALERARQAEQAGAIDEAAAAYDELVRLDSGEIGAWSLRGLFLERQRRYAEACESFRRSTSIQPTYVDHYNTANMLMAMGRHAEALVELDLAMKLDPKQAEGWCNRGICLAAMGKPDEARTSFDRAIAINDRLVNAYHCKAILLQKQGDKQAAVVARRKVVDLAPSAAAFIDLANALRDGLGPQIFWEPGAIEEQIVDAVERALSFPCDRKQAVWSWAEKLLRLQRIAHGRQSARRAGAPIEDAPAIMRYYEAADTAHALYPEDPWFEEKLADAQLLRASLPL